MRGGPLPVTELPHEDVGAQQRALAGGSSDRPAQPLLAPSRPEFWRSPLRGAWLTSVLGTLLVPAIAVIAATGFISRLAYSPSFHLPSALPSWSYAVNQGTHVTLGLMAVPLILAKLWSVMPKLFRRPVARNIAGALERLSLLALVGSVLVEFVTGVLDIEGDAPGSSSFFTVHYYGAWLFCTMFLLHACLKFPTVRRAYRERGVLKPLLDGVPETVPEPPVEGGLGPVNPAEPTISRRGLLAMVGGASLTIFAVQAGQTIGGPARSLAVLAPRGRVFGTGPNDFQVNHAAADAQITPAMTGQAWRLTAIGGRTVSLTRQQLLAMAQTSRTLTISCTEGWSTTQHWTGVRLADLARLVNAPAGASLQVLSLEPGAQATFGESQFMDARALLALRVNGADLSPDHGYPARVIVPNVPGTHNIKWVGELRFQA